MPDHLDQDPTRAHAVRELVLTGAALLVTVIVTVTVEAMLVGSLIGHVRAGATAAAASTAAFGAALLALGYGNLVYQLARWGRYRRAGGDRASHHDDEALFAPGADPGALTVLVPSYREDLSVVRQTVLSAVLQEYPDRRVVILVDDPPDPGDETAARALEAVRRLPSDIDRLLADPRRTVGRAAAALRARLAGRTTVPPWAIRAEAEELSTLWERAARWLEDQGRTEAAADHTGRLFVDVTFVRRAAACRAHGVRTLALAAEGRLTPDGLLADYHQLETMFEVDVSTFERKLYVNVSHEPNKAMNLNAYIGLLGGRWHRVERADGTHLIRDHDGVAGSGVVDVPGSRWLLTVDADSILAHDYALRLVRQMQRDEHARTAVMQSPYLAVPGAQRPIERAAGATTDIMHLVHQGSTHFRATFWVGANALLRVAALGDIAVSGFERGHRVTRFIQDRTVIEDTESTIDLVDAGWRLYNYPARMAYSATPADYGSLLIQRRRWANGGLLILPKLLRSYLRRGLRGRVGETAMRVHYLVSTSAVTIALLALMTLPFSPAVPTWLLAATCVPYFALYLRDLRLIGRRRRDILAVYALNLLLIPVQLGGILTSLHQALTGRRIPFGRTPKVHDRTAAPALYVVLTLILLAQWSIGAALDVGAGRLAHAVMAGGNALFLGAAVGRYMGWRHAVVDVAGPVRARLRRSGTPRPLQTTTRAAPGDDRALTAVGEQ